jgi:hypothetical protein
MRDYCRDARTRFAAPKRAWIDPSAVTVAAVAELEPAPSALAPFAESAAHFDPEALQVTAAIRPGTRLMDVVRALDSGGVEAMDVHRREATLDDVFLTLTKTEPSRPMDVAA